MDQGKPDMKAWEYRALSLEERILSRIRVDVKSGCHIFTGAKNTDGYGQVKNKGIGVRTHRWMWDRHHGAIPDGKHVLHKCDVPACVNIAHLYLGDHAQNMRDKVERGRSLDVPRGSAHKRPNAKVTEEQVIAIKVGLAAKRRQIDLACQFGVSRNLISEIALEKTWAHLNIHVH